MATYGVTPQGFVSKPTAQIVSELQAAMQLAFGAGINLTSQSVFGQLIGIMSDREAALWQVAQAAYLASDPGSASDTAQDNILALTGTARLPAAFSSVSVCCVGSNGTTIPIGKTFATAGTAIPFVTTASGTIVTLTAWATGQTFVTGQLITNGGNVYYCLTGGVGAVGGGGPTGTGASIADNLATWRYVGAGTAAVLVPCNAQTTGPNSAPAGTLTVVSTPIAGLTLVSNPLDALLGRNLETDAASRIRRSQLLHASGNAAADAVRAAILNALTPGGAPTGVTACSVLWNDGDVVDGNGLLPHSIEPIVLGGADLDVATAVFKSKAAGINQNGNTTVSVTDSQAVSRTVKFTRPVPVPIYIAITAVTGTGWDPVGGPGLVKQALANYALGTLLKADGTPMFPGYVSGSTVNASALYQAIFLIPGIVSLSAVNIGTAPSPASSADVTTAIRQIPTVAVANITFNGA